MKTFISEFHGMGRGLGATSMVFPGDIVEVSEILALSPEDTATLETTVLKYYKFRLDETRDCIVLGLGSLFNHSDEPNVSFSLEKESTGRIVMVFRATKIVIRSEQLFIDYRQDANVDVSEYLKQA